MLKDPVFAAWFIYCVVIAFLLIMLLTIMIHPLLFVLTVVVIAVFIPFLYVGYRIVKLIRKP